MTLPNFLLVGAQKAGTTWVANNLGQHPEVFMPRGEIHYFDREDNFNRGLDWYKKFFARSEKKLIGEKTPNYLWVVDKKITSRFGNHLPFVQRNIYNALPEAKLILVLRDPVERLISALNHYRRQGQISPFANVDEVLIGNKRHLSEQFGLFSMGKYYSHIKAYQKYFSPSQMLILTFEEDIVREPILTLKKVCNFLEINPSFDFLDIDKKANEFTKIRVGTALVNHLNHFPTSSRLQKLSKYFDGPLMGPQMTKVRPSEVVISELNKMYARENEKLFDLLGYRVASWQRNETKNSLCESAS